MMKLADNHDHIELSSIGNSLENRPIHMITFKTSKENPIVFYECGIHAREWSSVSSCLWVAVQLSDLESNGHILAKFTVQIVPILNPDGYQ